MVDGQMKTQEAERMTGAQLVAPPAAGPGFDVLSLWKAAEGLSRSELMPQAFRGKAANCFLALEIATRLGLGAFEVAQNLYLVNGQPSWSAKYMIGLANSRGPFRGGLQFETTGEGESLAVTCWARHAETDERVSRTVSMENARLAGWTKNPKYREIPEQMLSYRAATFLVRLYCPEVMLGMKTADEVEDIAAAEGEREAEAVVVPAPVAAMAAEIGEPDPPAEPAEEPEMIFIPCPDCEGGTEEDMMDCATCGGAGEVPQPITTDSEKETTDEA